MKDPQEIQQSLQKVLDENPGLRIHPGWTLEKWGAVVARKNGACPCVPDRPACPCENYLDDIEQMNHCRCYFFCNEEYLREYNECVTAGRKS